MEEFIHGETIRSVNTLRKIPTRSKFGKAFRSCSDAFISLCILSLENFFTKPTLSRNPAMVMIYMLVKFKTIFTSIFTKCACPSQNVLFTKSAISL